MGGWLRPRGSPDPGHRARSPGEPWRSVTSSEAGKRCSVATVQTPTGSSPSAGVNGSQSMSSGSKTISPECLNCQENSPHRVFFSHRMFSFPLCWQLPASQTDVLARNPLEVKGEFAQALGGLVLLG